MAIEAIKGAGMVYQGSTSTAQIKEQAQGRTEVSSADNQVVSDSIARNIQAMKTNRVTIKIVDKKTKEVIKEFPPEKTLDMIAKVWEMAGLMVDEKR